MYYNFDFNNDSQFFENSSTMALMRKNLNENKHLKKIEQLIMEVSLKLWAESIIKHNLDINMTKIDHINLISDKNSAEVIQHIGKIIFKAKHLRTDKDFEILSKEGMVSNYLQLITLSLEEDVCSNLKKEFVDFQNLKVINKSTPKFK